MSEPLFISTLVNRVLAGEIRIPSFQRGFVWDADRVAHLMDSVYKGYPFGTLLFWRTAAQLRSEKRLGPFELPPPKANYPIDYILDGQQRATSLFGVFQNRLPHAPETDASWAQIYFDARGAPSAQDSRFFYLAPEEVDPNRHFPLRLLFDAPQYRRHVGKLEEEVAVEIDELYRRFTTTVIPVQSFTTDDRAAVAIVFERINRLGVKLDTLQLLSAWSWSEEFDLQGQFEELADEIAPFGFRELAEDSDLLLRCCAAIICHDASPTSIVELKGEVIRTRFAEIKNGIRGAIDFLRTHFNVYSVHVLPFTTLMVPLSVFFATEKDQSTHPDASQQKRLTQWMWRTFFTRRYSKRLEQLNQDIKEVVRLKNRNPKCELGNFTLTLDDAFWTGNAFNTRNVDSKTFILMLASAGPLDFVGGGKVALDSVLRECNKKEFHHLYPRAYLKGLRVPDDRANALVNFCMIPRASNNLIGDSKPSEYRNRMPSDPRITDQVLASALCPASLFSDNFDQFVRDRCELLRKHAYGLMYG